MKYICGISGKDSLATAIVSKVMYPNEDILYFFSDTGAELPPVYEWLNKVEKKLGIEIQRIEADLESIIRESGVLPSHKMRYCTAAAKIKPIEDFYAEVAKGGSVKMLVGIRADEQRKGYVQKRKDIDIRPEYPLQKMKLGIEQVYNICEAKGLLPPSFRWHLVEKEVREKFKDNDFINSLPRWYVNQVFAGRSRPNCYFCFYQRLYELAYLLEEWPEYFEKAANIEQDVAEGDERETAFFWKQGKSMDFIREQAPIYRAKRAKEILANLQKLKADRMQMKLFAGDDMDMMTVSTSCGIFCGK